MPVTINLPTILSRRTGQQQITVNASNLREVIDQIDKDCPGFKGDILVGNSIRHSFIVSINGEHIQNNKALD
jgi:hypothetical protein